MKGSVAAKRVDLSRSVLIGLGAMMATSVAGCARPADKAALLKSIAGGCHIPRDYLKLDPSGAVHFQPPMYTPINALDCVSKELQRNHLGPIAFIGHEQYRPDPK